MQLAADPLREQRSFTFAYKSRKIKPKMNVLEGSKNDWQWGRRMTSLLISLRIATVVTDGVIPSCDASEHELDVFSSMQQDGLLLLYQSVNEQILDSVSGEDPHLYGGI